MTVVPKKHVGAGVRPLDFAPIAVNATADISCTGIYAELRKLTTSEELRVVDEGSTRCNLSLCTPSG
jgi:hypothetical protein